MVMVAIDKLKSDPRIKDHWVRRGFAFIIDYIILFVIQFIISIIAVIFIIALILGSSSPTDFYGDSGSFMAIVVIILILAVIYLLISILYWVVLDAKGGTFGKRLLKLQVVSTEDEMKFGKAVVRNISKIAGIVIGSYFGLAIGILILVLFVGLDVLFGLNQEGDPRQKYTDRIAKTNVIRTDIREDFPIPPIPVPTPTVTASAPEGQTVKAQAPATIEAQVQEKAEEVQPVGMEKVEEPIPQKETRPSPLKGRRLPSTPIIIVVAIVGIIIVAAIVSGIMFGGEKESSGGGSQNKLSTEPTTWEDMETIEGDITGGGPMTALPDERVNFEVEDTVYQMDIILTWNPQSMDLDLKIEDPDGIEKGSSGNSPGEPESVRIKGKDLPAGTWTAVIDPFLALNVHYNLEITYYHESGNLTGGEGELLYQGVKNLVEESSEETETFEVGEGYESLLIQVEISADAGSMNIKILNPDGDEIYTEEISGEGTISDQETADPKAGEWKVNYSLSDFTGTVVVQVIGI